MVNVTGAQPEHKVLQPGPQNDTVTEGSGNAAVTAVIPAGTGKDSKNAAVMGFKVVNALSVNE